MISNTGLTYKITIPEDYLRGLLLRFEFIIKKTFKKRFEISKKPYKHHLVGKYEYFLDRTL